MIVVLSIHDITLHRKQLTIMTDQVRAVVVDPGAPNRLSLQQVEVAAPKSSEALIRVHSISLNRGEIRNAGSAPAGFRPGWDLAGVVEQAAADGTGPKAGDRVVGFVASGAWAERVAVPTHSLAVLPAGVTFAQAATLPVAGLTALYGLDKGGNLLRKRVLITGAAGGVGHFAVQLAHATGATVIGHTRSTDRVDLVKAAGAQYVATGDGTGNSTEFAPYDLILDGVGGQFVSQGIGLLSRNGLYVLYGTTGGTEVTVNAMQLYRGGGLSLYGLTLFHEVIYHQAASIGLARLIGLVAEGTLKPLIAVEAPIEQIGALSQQLMDRGYAGKAVLHFLA